MPTTAAEEQEATLFSPVCSITSTRRRRFFWAAWWSAAPTRLPFRQPDAAEGGARTREEALRAAERNAGRSLQEIDGTWARAWSNVLTGKPPWSTDAAREKARPTAARESSVTPSNRASVWQILGLSGSSSIEEIKRAYRKRALETHPDRGGDSAAFRAVQAAYESALKRRSKRR